MLRKSFFLSLFLTISITIFSQDSPQRLFLGTSFNIPSSPTSLNYGVGFGLFEQYEYLLGEHWSLVQVLGFQNINGKEVEEFYENGNINVNYEYFRTVSLQLGAGFYFGEGQSTFFILFKGGYSKFWTVNPAYPEVRSSAGDLVKQEILREERNGSFWFFDPKIGWQFDRLQISADYHGTVNQVSQINVYSLSVAYNLIKP